MRRVHLALLGFLSLTPACSSLPVAGSDRDLIVSEGSTFKVVVNSLSGTGQAWQVDGGDETVQLLRREPPVARSAVRAQEGPAVVEEHTFTFLARRSGTVTLRFTYTRPSEDRSLPSGRSYRVQVIRC
jgi:hypothetical protein